MMISESCETQAFEQFGCCKYVRKAKDEFKPQIIQIM